MNTFDCDLLVVGLGPVGDVLAALAQQQGLSVIGIDRSPELYPFPRAAVLDHEIMRIMQMIGVAKRIEPHTRVTTGYQFLTADREVLLDFAPAEVGEFGWAESYSFHQPAFESVLRERLAELGVDVRLGAAFTGLSQDDDGVTASVVKGDTTSTIRARYVVGCDGAWSPVREQLGLPLFDYGFDEPWLVLDASIDEAHAPPVVAQQICDPRRPITHLAMTPGRFRWEFMLKPGESAEDISSDDRIRELVAPWGCADHMVIERKAVYRFHALVAERWRDGRVLIAGDAAHQMPPFAGQGMCSGIRDAANLAWKLAAVVHGNADDGILDSYQEERDPHVRVTIETAIAMGRVVCITDEDKAAQRNSDMLARRARGEQDVSLQRPRLNGRLFSDTPKAGCLFPQPMIAGKGFDALLGTGPAIVGRDLPQDLHPAVKRIDLSESEAGPFSIMLDDWLTDAGTKAALVRPDRYIFGTGDAHHLIEIWQNSLGLSPQTNVQPSAALADFR